MKSPPTTTPIPRLKLRVTSGVESILRKGHPWLYSESIREQNREGQPGELAVIYDRNNLFLGIGLFDPFSPIRVRMLHQGKPTTLDLHWWRMHLRRALESRTRLFDDQTTGYRCCNGESDGWPGFVLDRYDSNLVLKLYTAAWFPRLDELIQLLREEIPHEQLVLRLSRNIQEIAQAPSPPDRAWISHPLYDGRIFSANSQPTPPKGKSNDETPNHRVIFRENGLRFEADLVSGQKTGFFLDQRENRKIVEGLASGRHVLNTFSFSGGFSVYAARGGASSVTDLDISSHALESAERNFALNRSHPSISQCKHHVIQGDVFEWLKTSPDRQFDLVVLDPPSLAKRESERLGAIKAYQKLALQGIQRLRPSGILVAASCSAHVSADEFFEAVWSGIRSSGRNAQEIQRTRHPADHPATFPEAEYLKCIYLAFQPA